MVSIFAHSLLVEILIASATFRRKFTTKKHKAWTGDGYLIMRGGYAYLQDVSGKDLGRTKFDSAILPGSRLSVSGNEVEVDALMAKDEYLKTTQRRHDAVIKTPNLTPSNVPKTLQPEKQIQSFPAKYTVPVAKSKATKSRFKNPLLVDTVLPIQNGPEPTPRHDPHQPGALVMKRPKSAAKGKKIVDVVVDPILCRHLRHHQREGVQFLYECVMGERSSAGDGAILADEMGLGKTLQTIALLWTLLKQNPIYEDPPVIKKALIVCPATLIINWKKEFKKWLGNERIGVFVADGSKSLRDFTFGKSYSIMVIGYEKLRNVQEELKQGSGIDIVVADEGHRLKTLQNKSAQAIRSLDTSRRIILSGTPIQNDLSEFFMMVDLVNPGVMGTYTAFKRDFEGPIVKSRQPEASRKEIEKGESRTEELSSLTSTFILRRTVDVIFQYLPSKTEYVLFCKPTSAQAEVYRTVLGSSAFGNILGSPEASLQLITLLKKACNAPSLLSDSSSSTEEAFNHDVAKMLSSISSSVARSNASTTSSKLQVLGRLLSHLRSSTDEKIVLVSNYTSTLDLLQSHLVAQSLPYLRLDGSTPSSKRQELVDSFNKTSAQVCFAFLLSAKAGGVGLNLIGASRLVLFDVDWNPSTDMQAMARIHRDGQKREVRIYRLLVAGALDEKIWQRQVTKMGLADSVMDQKANASSFSVKELRDLFTLDTSSVCQTHSLLGCCCGGLGGEGKTADVATSTDGQDVVELTDIDYDKEGEDLPEIGTLIKASQVDMHIQERIIQERDRAARTRMNTSKMQSLMQYRHIDTSKFSRACKDAFAAPADEQEELEALVEDDVLLSVLKEEGNRVKYVFSKTSS